MKKVQAFASEFDTRSLYYTARSAREAEFDAMMLRVRQSLPSACGDNELWTALAGCLRSNTYGTARVSFIKAAEYLKEYKQILGGTALDPQETSE